MPTPTREVWLGSMSGAVLSLALGAIPAAAHTAQPASSNETPGLPSDPEQGASGAIVDPWQGSNRRLYGFNRGVDRAVVAPVVHVYMRATPRVVRRGLSNVLRNLEQPRTAANDLLQGHLSRAGQAAGSFLLDSTVGVLGLFDVSGRVGIERHRADFGQTLGRYGVQPGPYLIVPFAGPSDVRDGLGRVVDALTDPIGLLAGPAATPYASARMGANAVETRAQLDTEATALDRDSADPYASLRSAYSQRRAYLVGLSTGEAQELPDIEPAPAAP
jgi:phospholipid-binding lipoprotein MlaA